jgi:hypothetical protein
LETYSRATAYCRPGKYYQGFYLYLAPPGGLSRAAWKLSPIVNQCRKHLKKGMSMKHTNTSKKCRNRQGIWRIILQQDIC